MPDLNGSEPGLGAGPTASSLKASLERISSLQTEAFANLQGFKTRHHPGTDMELPLKDTMQQIPGPYTIFTRNQGHLDDIIVAHLVLNSHSTCVLGDVIAAGK